MGEHGSKRERILGITPVVVMVLVLLAIMIEYLVPLSAPGSSRVTIRSTGRVLYETQPVPYLELAVSPPGYPRVGEVWTFRVYLVNRTSPEMLTYQECPNATVTVTLLSSGTRKTFELPTDENGVTTFQYLPDYTDIVFEAEIPGYSPSQVLVLTTHYVSHGFVDGLLTFSLLSIGGGFSSSYFISKKLGLSEKWVKLEKALISLMIILPAFVLIFAVYSKFFLETTWGYPQNVINGFITMSLLVDTFYPWAILFVSYCSAKSIVWLTQKETRSTSTK